MIVNKKRTPLMVTNDIITFNCIRGDFVDRRFIGGTLPFFPPKETMAAKKKLSLLRKQEWFRTP